MKLRAVVIPWLLLLVGPMFASPLPALATGRPLLQRREENDTAGLAMFLM